MDDLLLVATCLLPLGVYLAVTKGKGRQKARYACIGLSLAFFFFALGHSVVTAELVPMLPSWVPLREWVIYATGVLEVLIAVGLLTRRYRRTAGITAAVVLVLFLPANIYASLNYVGVGDHQQGPGYLWVRIPLQIFLFGWAIWPVLRPDPPIAQPAHS